MTTPDFFSKDYNINILDCTLRDGAHVNNGNFGENNIKYIINSLVDSNINIIELGFLQNKENISKDNTYFNNLNELEYYINKENLNKNSKFSIMIRIDDFDISKIIKSKYIHIIRFAFYYENMKLLPKYVEIAKSYGYDVYLNPLAVSTLNYEQKTDIYKYCNKLKPKCVSIVDTFGSLSFDLFNYTINIMDTMLNSDIDICLHLHENLSLSMGLIQHTLLNLKINRNFTIDCSINGMGRVPGNVPTELVVNFLNKNFNKEYDIIPLLKCIDLIINEEKKKRNWGYSADYFISASLNIHRSYSEYFIEEKGLNLEKAYLLMNKIKKQGVGNRFDEKIASKILKEYINFDLGNKKISAIVAVKKNSVRVKNKNTKKFADTNLLEIKLKTLKTVNQIDEIVLSTNCEIAKNIASKITGIKIIDRPEYYCSDECSSNEVLSFIANQCSNDNILYCPVTSPFISKFHYERVINKYFNLENNDSVVTKSDIKDFLWNKNKTINYNQNNLPKSQDLSKDYFKINCGCSILPKSIMITKGYIVGDFPFFIDCLDKYGYIDIDEEFEFLSAEIIYKNFL